MTTTLDIIDNQWVVQKIENGTVITTRFGKTLADVIDEAETSTLPVDLSPSICNGFSGIEIKNSSQIIFIGYKHDENLLSVTFKGGAEYHYKAVPVSIWQQFIISESKGVFLNANIKNKYEFYRVAR